jgi:hypothetical protein
MLFKKSSRTIQQNLKKPSDNIHVHTTFTLQIFFMCKIIYNIFVKYFVVFYTVNLYICVFTICSTSYSLYETLMTPLNIRLYVCMYALMGRKFLLLKSTICSTGMVYKTNGYSVLNSCFLFCK